MTVAVLNIIEELDQQDKDKVSYFVQLLLKQTKYQALKKEIARRREEIQHGETLTHEAIWSQMNV